MHGKVPVYIPGNGSEARDLLDGCPSGLCSFCGMAWVVGYTLQMHAAGSEQKMHFVDGLVLRA